MYNKQRELDRSQTFARPAVLRYRTFWVAVFYGVDIAVDI
jgi:hypothetical protein